LFAGATVSTAVDNRLRWSYAGSPSKSTIELPSTETREPLRDKLGQARTSALVLISTGVGISVFGILLTWIVREHEVLVVAAAGLIPLAIGVGFLVDYTMQKRELARFGLEVERPE
jgi:hypothetical protein